MYAVGNLEGSANNLYSITLKSSTQNILEIYHLLKYILKNLRVILYNNMFIW